MITSDLFDYQLTNMLPPEWLPWVWPVTYGVMALGLYWLVKGWSRTQRWDRDAALITRAVVKLAAGLALIYAIAHDMLPYKDWEKPFDFYAESVAYYLAIWLCVTALARLALLVRRIKRSERGTEGNKSVSSGWHWT